jgi:hypothetical protein
MAIDALGIELPFPALAVKDKRYFSCGFLFLGNKSPANDKYIFPRVQVDS